MPLVITAAEKKGFKKLSVLKKDRIVIRNVTVENKYRVPKQLWGKFKTDAAKTIYNSVYESTIDSQELIMHPESMKKKLSHDEWTTICHNMACLAAWNTDAYIEFNT